MGNAGYLGCFNYLASIFLLTLNANINHVTHVMHKTLIFLLVIFSSFSYASDIDRDGLEDETERKIGTLVTSKDTDGDGSTDGDEVNYQTDPLNPNHKILKIGESKPTGRRYVAGRGLFSKGYYEPTGYEREVVVSFNDKIENKKINYLSSMQRDVFLLKLESSYQDKKRKENLTAIFRKTDEERKIAIARSPRYEEIKKMRLENSRLKKVYEISNSLVDKNAYIEHKKSLLSLENKEYEIYKYPAIGYSHGNDYDDLEDKVEELEDKVSDYEDKIRDLENAVEEME
jgi:hypothetical protein